MSELNGTCSSESISVSASRAGHGVRHAFLLLACLAGFLVLAPGSAWARSGQRPWRSTAAPTNVLALTDYIVEPAGDPPPPEIGGEISFDTLMEHAREPKEPPPGNQQTPPPPPGGAGFSFPDTSKSGRSSMSNPAFVDTMSPGSPSGQFHPSGVGGDSRPTGKVRRGILGVHPIAILVGLVALHIFIVTVAAK